MTTFKDFFFSKKNCDLPADNQSLPRIESAANLSPDEANLPTLKQSMNIASAKVMSELNGLAMVGNIGNAQAQEFSQKASQLVHSESFIADLSNEIWVPRDEESEDEFVERAKNTMRDLLKRKLGG